MHSSLSPSHPLTLTSLSSHFVLPSLASSLLPASLFSTRRPGRGVAAAEEVGGREEPPLRMRRLGGVERLPLLLPNWASNTPYIQCKAPHSHTRACLSVCPSVYASPMEVVVYRKLIQSTQEKKFFGGKIAGKSWTDQSET